MNFLTNNISTAEFFLPRLCLAPWECVLSSHSGQLRAWRRSQPGSESWAAWPRAVSHLLVWALFLKLKSCTFSVPGAESQPSEGPRYLDNHRSPGKSWIPLDIHGVLPACNIRPPAEGEVRWKDQRAGRQTEESSSSYFTRVPMFKLF